MSLKLKLFSTNREGNKT